MKRFAASVSICVALAGCAQAVPGHAPFHFGMTSAETVAPTVIEARRTVEGPHGSLTLDLSKIAQRLAQRKVLYTVADIDHIEITITQGSTFTTSATIAKADLVGGHATYTFTNLPSGFLEVAIKAKDAGGKVIGEDTQVVGVTAGQTASYAPAILLYPSAASPAGGGGSTSTTGLTIGLDIGDGGTLKTLQTLASIPIEADELYLDGAKNVWALWPDQNPAATPGDARLVKISPTGLDLLANTATAAVDPDPSSHCPIRFDGAGNVWASYQFGPLKKFKPDGSLLVDLSPLFADDVASCADGSFWVLANDGIDHFDGPPLVARASFPAPAGPGHAFRIFLDAQENLIIFRQGYTGDPTAPHDVWSVTKVSPTGSVLASYTRHDSLALVSKLATDTGVPALRSYIDQDPQGNFWVLSPDEQRLVKLAPDLTVAKEVPTYPGPLAMDVDAAGKLWVYALLPNNEQRIITRYDATGAVEASAYVPTVNYGPGDLRYYVIAGDGNNNLWLGGHPQSYKVTF